MSVHYEADGRRPEVASAIDRPTADALADADPALSAGADDEFCGGADLKASRSGDPARVSRLAAEIFGGLDRQASGDWRRGGFT